MLNLNITHVAIAVTAVSIVTILVLGWGIVPMPTDMAGVSFMLEGAHVSAEDVPWYGWSLENFLSNF